MLEFSHVLHGANLRKKERTNLRGYLSGEISSKTLLISYRSQRISGDGIIFGATNLVDVSDPVREQEAMNDIVWLLCLVRREESRFPTRTPTLIVACPIRRHRR